MADQVRCPRCRSDDVYGVEVQGLYDGVLFWECGACDAQWHRFSPEVNPRRFNLAKQAMGAEI